jgi:glycine betaine/choline ABC-type transport system substrate-binding protein
MRRPAVSYLTALAVAVFSLALAGCGGGGSGQEQAGGRQEPIARNPQNASKKVTVGAKNFTEQYVLGEIYSQALEAAGYDVDKQLNIGSEVLAFKALREGEIDAYPEYTGTVLTNFYRVPAREVPRDAQKAYAEARKRLKTDRVTAMPITPFDNSYVLGATRETAERLRATTTSQLAPRARDLRITGYPECRQRLDCLVGIERAYDMDFKDFVASENTYEVLDQDEADIGFLFTTDGQLATGKYRTFRDDKDFFPPYNVSFLVRDQAARRLGPEAQRVVERVQKPLTDRAMIELNSRVVVDKQRPEDVARQYLREEGFVR